MDNNENTGAALAPTDAVRLENKVSSFRLELVSYQKDRKEAAGYFNAGKRGKLYANLQEAFILASELLLPENAETLDGILARYKLKRDARQNTNPWMAPVNLLFGKLVDEKDGTRTIIPDKSAKKYAPSFRYMAEEKWDPETIASELEKFKSRKNGVRLAATEKLGRELGKGDVDEDRDEHDLEDDQMRDLLWSIGEPIASLPIPTRKAVDDLEYVMLWGIARTAIGSPRRIDVYGMMTDGHKYSKALKVYLDNAAKEVTKYHKNGGYPKRGNWQPKLVEENVLKPVLAYLRARDQELRAPEPQDTTPAEPTQGKPKRKAIKTSETVLVEGQEVADATA